VDASADLEARYLTKNASRVKITDVVNRPMPEIQL
jgi:hypothetical protein